jgi:hypothetical protein
MQSEGEGDSLDIVDGDVPLAALDPADVVVVKAAQFGQFLLRPVTFLP